MELLCSGSSVESMLRRNMTRQSPGLQPSALVTASLRRLVLRPQASLVCRWRCRVGRPSSLMLEPANHHHDHTQGPGSSIQHL